MKKKISFLSRTCYICWEYDREKKLKIDSAPINSALIMILISNNKYNKQCEFMEICVQSSFLFIFENHFILLIIHVHIMTIPCSLFKRAKKKLQVDKENSMQKENGCECARERENVTSWDVISVIALNGNFENEKQKLNMYCTYKCQFGILNAKLHRQMRFVCL